MSSSLNKRKEGILRRTLRRTFRRLGKDFGMISRNKKTNNLSQTIPSQTTPSQTTPSQSTPSQSTVTKNMKQYYTTNAEIKKITSNIPTIPEGDPLILPEVPKTNPSIPYKKPYQMTGEEHNKRWLLIEKNLKLSKQEKIQAQMALKELNRHLFPDKKGGKTKKTKKKKQKKRRTYKR